MFNLRDRLKYDKVEIITDDKDIILFINIFSQILPARYITNNGKEYYPFIEQINGNKILHIQLPPNNRNWSNAIVKTALGLIELKPHSWITTDHAKLGHLSIRLE